MVVGMSRESLGGNTYIDGIAGNSEGSVLVACKYTNTSPYI
jgi:hypothetical protein